MSDFSVSLNTLPDSFENALSELESIVKTLEDGNIPLETSVKAYERGIQLKAFCEKKLSDAQLKIEEVMKSAQGIETRPFDINNPA